MLHRALSNATRSFLFCAVVLLLWVGAAHASPFSYFTFLATGQASIPIPIPSASASVSAASAGPAPKPIEVAPAERARVTNALSKLPLSFEPNHGQSADEVRFLTRAPGYLLQLTATEMRLLIKGPVEATASVEADALNSRKKAQPTGLTHALRFTWLNANPDAHSQGEAPLPGTVNYLKGSDATTWRTAIPTYERVRYSEIYPGIDLVYYGNGRQIEYDLIVQPGADPSPIALTLEGADATLTDTGELTLTLSDGRHLQLKAPVITRSRAASACPSRARIASLTPTPAATSVSRSVPTTPPCRLPLIR